jgi:hypothetical protein
LLISLATDARSYSPSLAHVTEALDLRGYCKQTRFVRFTAPSSGLRAKIVAYGQQAVAQRLLG